MMTKIIDIQRYNIKPEGLGEINIDEDTNGDWIRYNDIQQSDAEKQELIDMLKRCSTLLSVIYLNYDVDKQLMNIPDEKEKIDKLVWKIEKGKPWEQINA